MQVGELQPGDLVYIEDNFGQLYAEPVKSITHYHVIIGSQRFYKKSGWEVQFKNTQLEKRLKPHRDRIHYGNGLLFTKEEAERRSSKRAEALRREELIYSLSHLSTRQLRKNSIETLEHCVQLLSGEQT